MIVSTSFQYLQFVIVVQMLSLVNVKNKHTHTHTTQLVSEWWTYRHLSSCHFFWVSWYKIAASNILRWIQVPAGVTATSKLRGCTVQHEYVVPLRGSLSCSPPFYSRHVNGATHDDHSWKKIRTSAMNKLGIERGITATFGKLSWSPFVIPYFSS